MYSLFQHFRTLQVFQPNLWVSYNLRADRAISPRIINDFICLMEIQRVYCEVKTKFCTLFRRNSRFKEWSIFTFLCFMGSILWYLQVEKECTFNWQSSDVTYSTHYFEYTKITCPTPENKPLFWWSYHFTLNKLIFHSYKIVWTCNHFWPLFPTKKNSSENIK